MARFWVRDNGRGIATENQLELFTQFTRLDQLRAEGHGLGLSIAYWIVDRHGGKIEVESQEGVGTNFSVLLPLASQKSA